MSYLDHIRHANNFDSTDFRPFLIDGVRVGWIGPALAERLRDFPDVFRVDAAAVALADRLADFDARSAAVDAVLRVVATGGAIPGWRDEPYPVTPVWGRPPLMQIERAACPVLGIRAWGVHMNGYVRRADGLHLWIARRARDKPTYPGMLDNTVAGGQPIGLGLKENLIKECAEEAGIPADLAAQAVPVGIISYRHRMPDDETAAFAGVKPDQQFCYDLELPEDFTPVPRDGEIEHFELWPIARVAETVRDTFEFKFNCNLVIIDFLMRHGLLDPDTEPDYAALAAGLHAAD